MYFTLRWMCTCVQEGGEISTQSSAQIAVIPGTAIVLLPVGNQIKTFAQDGEQ